MTVPLTPPQPSKAGACWPEDPDADPDDDTAADDDGADDADEEVLGVLVVDDAVELPLEHADSSTAAAVAAPNRTDADRFTIIL